MKKNLVKFISVKFNWLVIIGFVFLLIAFSRNGSIKKNNKQSAATDSCNCFSSSPFTGYPVYFNNKVPGDITKSLQSQLDCFAWQEFIALNWPTDNSSFGTPLNLNPVQWETYMPRNVLFQENGAPPPNWGTLVSDKYAAKFKSQRLLLNKMRTKLLTFKSKFDESDTLQGLDFGQAAPFNGPSWLGAQNKTNVWYEIMLNKDYYDFVVQKGYYNAATQHDSAKAGVPLTFPAGVINGITGAIELKAAWMEVDNPTSPKWKRYKLSMATVLDATTNKLRTTQVALVGLHILHKTTNQPTWVWATFEQIDNVPNTSGPSSPYGYNFFDSTCQSQNITVKKASGKGDTAITVSCTVNTSPAYYLKQGLPVPIQITRLNPIDATDAAPVNAKMQASIKQFYPNAVWQYYQLVDVIWSQTLQPDPITVIPVPRNINVSAMQSGAKIVANSTMESYVQNINTCYNCHVYGNIAPYPPDSANNNLFGDFSFAISFATYPKLNRVGSKLHHVYDVDKLK